MKITIPELNKGEIYAGTIIRPDGSGHHIILLDGDNDEADYNAQMEWAKSIGGDLPDRVEQSILFAYLKDRFKKSWYCSNTQNAAYADCAWFQDFLYGHQYDYYENGPLRARAVRRIAI